MFCKHLFTALIIFTSFALFGCGGGGGGGAGLNGAVTLTASVQGTSIVGTATYTNPQEGNLIGTEITISTDRPDLFGPPITVNTNNSGSVSFVIHPVHSFNGNQTFSVIAQTGNLQDFKTNLQMSGRTVSLTPPPAITQAAVLAFGAAVDVPIPVESPFVTLSDPFGSPSGVTWNITYSLLKTDPTDTLSPTDLQTTTIFDGTAPFPGATATMHLPSSLTAVNTLTINWTATEVVIGGATPLTASGSTVLKLNYGDIPAIVFTPGSLTFSNTENTDTQHTLAISGGVPPYKATTVSTAPGFATGTVAGTTLTVTRNSDSAFDGVTITVTDSVGTQGSVTVTGVLIGP